MSSDIIKVGDKIDIRILEQVARAEKTGESAHVYKSQVLDLKKNGDIEIAMPFEGTKIILLPLELRYEFLFIGSGGMYKANGRIKERYKSENRYMLLIELSTQPERFQRREYYRLECGLDLIYIPITKEQSELPDTNAIFAEVRDEDFYQKQIRARSMDISGGGIRFRSEAAAEQGDFLLMSINLKSDDIDIQVDTAGRVLSSTRMVIDSQVMYEHRVAFIVKDKKVSESIVRFVFAEERKSRKYGKG